MRFSDITLTDGVSASFLALMAQSMTTGFNIQILLHFLIPYLLLTLPQPVLWKGAQICNIGRPGEKNRTIDLNDFRCLKTFEAGKFSLLKDAMKFVFMMDLFTHASRLDIITLFIRITCRTGI